MGLARKLKEFVAWRSKRREVRLKQDLVVKRRVGESFGEAFRRTSVEANWNDDAYGSQRGFIELLPVVVVVVVVSLLLVGVRHYTACRPGVFIDRQADCHAAADEVRGDVGGHVVALCVCGGEG